MFQQSKQCLKGENQVISDVVRSHSMKPILNKLKAYLASGGQCYVVCPLVEESEAIDSKAATSIYAANEKLF